MEKATFIIILFVTTAFKVVNSFPGERSSENKNALEQKQNMLSYGFLPHDLSWCGTCLGLLQHGRTRHKRYILQGNRKY